MKELLKLINSDYQKRGNSYPKALIPDSIEVTISDNGASISFDFKNTTESEALEWYKKSKEFKVISKFQKDYDVALSTSQDGDFKDDWQKLTVELTKKDTTKSVSKESKSATKQTSPQESPSSTKNGVTPTMGQGSAIGNEYTYILTTLEQRKAIDLSKHSTKLKKIIEGFFEDRLLSVTFDKESYTLKLKDDFTIGDKRRLGRLISEGSDLQKFVKKVIYNGNKDTSGQLFRIKKSSEVTNEEV